MIRVVALVLLLVGSACHDRATPRFQRGDMVQLITEQAPYPGEISFVICPTAWTPKRAKCFYDVRFGHFGSQRISEYELRKVD